MVFNPESEADGGMQFVNRESFMVVRGEEIIVRMSKAGNNRLLKDIEADVLQDRELNSYANLLVLQD